MALADRFGLLNSGGRSCAVVALAVGAGHTLPDAYGISLLKQTLVVVYVRYSILYVAALQPGSRIRRYLDLECPYKLPLLREVVETYIYIPGG